MPVMNGVEVTGIIREKYPETQVVILTTYDDDVFVHDALSKGAVGYLLKDAQPTNLIMSLLAVREGSVFISPTIAQKLVKQLEYPMPRSFSADHEEYAYWLDELTKREKEVLLLVARGYTNKEIAQNLFIEEQTVKNHVSVIYSKIGIHDRIGVTLLVNKMNLKQS
jgi:DNA-binding NarL/FixJ family response regulator